MNEARPFLPHDPPAIMLEGFEPWSDGKSEGLRGSVCLARCGLLWMTRRGLPVAFSLEVLGQLSAVFLRRREGGEALVGGRLAAVESFTPTVEYLPAEEVLELKLTHRGGSSAGYHKFAGEIAGADGRALVAAHFNVLALVE